MWSNVSQVLGIDVLNRCLVYVLVYLMWMYARFLSLFLSLFLFVCDFFFPFSSSPFFASLSKPSPSLSVCVCDCVCIRVEGWFFFLMLHLLVLLLLFRNRFSNEICILNLLVFFPSSSFSSCQPQRLNPSLIIFSVFRYCRNDAVVTVVNACLLLLLSSIRNQKQKFFTSKFFFCYLRFWYQTFSHFSPSSIAKPLQKREKVFSLRDFFVLLFICEQKKSIKWGNFFVPWSFSV